MSENKEYQTFIHFRLTIYKPIRLCFVYKRRKGGQILKRKGQSKFSKIDFVQNLKITGNSLSEALIFASTNSQYDNRLFIELQVQYMTISSSNLERTCCVQKLFLTFGTIFVHNMFSPCSAKRRASDKDLPLQSYTKLIEKLF